ncbi:MAG: hypothetical protein COA58_03060 [Bacteroidetes bacterium]|nr:MAG: hypothetical protein COA58_03060 [Bacteroidota bacterium]
MKLKFTLLVLIAFCMHTSKAQISFDYTSQVNNSVDSSEFDYNWTVNLANNSTDKSDSVFVWTVTSLDKTSSWELTVCSGDECIADPGVGNDYGFHLRNGENEIFKIGFSIFERAGYGQVTVAVRSVKDGGIKDSATLEIATLSSVDFANARTFKTYPNPAKDIITVDFINGKSQVIKVYDILGNIQISKNINSGDKLDLSKLTKGVYILRTEGISNYSKVIQKQ